MRAAISAVYNQIERQLETSLYWIPVENSASVMPLLSPEKDSR